MSITLLLMSDRSLGASVRRWSEDFPHLFQQDGDVTRMHARRHGRVHDHKKTIHSRRAADHLRAADVPQLLQDGEPQV